MRLNHLRSISLSLYTPQSLEVSLSLSLCDRDFCQRPHARRRRRRRARARARKHTHRHTDRQTDRHTDRQTDRQTDTHTHTHTHTRTRIRVKTRRAEVRIAQGSIGASRPSLLRSFSLVFFLLPFRSFVLSLSCSFSSPFSPLFFLSRVLSPPPSPLCSLSLVFVLLPVFSFVLSLSRVGLIECSLVCGCSKALQSVCPSATRTP